MTQHQLGSAGIIDKPTDRNFLATAITIGSGIIAINLTSAHLLTNGPGHVVIGNELFHYTGLSGNTLTGVSRGDNHGVWTAPQENHYVGDLVMRANWFIKANGALPMVGINPYVPT